MGGERKKLTCLAAALERHPDEVRADLQQYYGLDLDGMGRDYTHEHAACLVSQLPRESRTARAEQPACEWGPSERLLALIEYGVRVLAWQNSRDGEKGRRRPKPLEAPGSRGGGASKVDRTDTAYIDEALGRWSRGG